MSEKLSKSVHLFHGALSDKNKRQDLTDILHGDVVLHRDDLTLDHDVKGAENVTKYYQAYYDTEFSSHELLAVGYDVKEHVAFAFWVDKGATLQQEASARAESGGAPQHSLVRHTGSSACVGIAAYKFATGEHRAITDIYQMRQFTADEAAKSLKDVTKASQHLDIDAFKSSDAKLDSDVVLKNAQTYSSTWQSGDVDALDAIVSDDFQEFDAVLSGQATNLKETKEMITSTVRAWEYTDGYGAQALAQPDGNRTFIFWSAEGKVVAEQGEPKRSLYGLNFLLYDGDAKIRRIASFRQPQPQERKKLLK